MTYDEIIQEAGKRVEKNVYYIVNGQRTDVDIDNIENVKISFNSPLIGTLMQGAELTLKEPINGEIYIEIEARYQSYTATKTYGPYFLKQEPTYQADSKNYLHILYDAIIKSMVQYEELNISYPCTVFQFFTGLVNACGYTTNISSLPNGSNQLSGDKYIGLNYTYRDVFDDLAVANGILLYVDGNVLKQAEIDNNNPIVVNDDILKNQNIEFGQHFGPINTIVLSRAVSDNIEINDPTGVAENGVKEFKISDNQMMNDNNRSDYLPALLSQLNGLEYDIYDTELTGYGNITPLQRVHFTTDENNYYSYVFNNEIVITDGYKQTIYTELPEETNTDYTMTDKTDKRINQTTLIVDKQNQIIQSMITNYLDFLQNKSDSNYIEIENVYANGITKLEISGQMSLLYPSNDLYPSDDLYSLDSYLIIEDENEEIKKYQLGINYLNNGDKYVYTYSFNEENNSYVPSAKIIRSNNTEEILEAPIFELPNGNYKIYMESFNNLNYNVDYVIQNDLTNTLATNTQLATAITQTRNEIDIMASQVVNKDTIIADINASVQNGQGIVSLTGNSVIIQSDNFKLDSKGSIEAKNGKFSGIIDGGQIKVNGDNYDDKNLPFIEIYTTKPNEFSTIDTAGVRQWAVGISAYNYNNDNYNEPVIRTETADGYAELEGTQVNAFGFNNVSLEEKKKNFENLENALSIIKKTSIYKFNYKGEKDNYKKHIGLVIGDNYSYSKDLTNNENNAVDLYSMVGVCFKAIQEQQQIIENLQKEMEEIRNGKNTI